jgi:AcrR family transcriptional regulator
VSGLSGDIEPPKQARSRRSYHRILDATADLLADRSFDAITVDEIVARAGYTKGAFYARFDSKASLLRHLVTRLTDGALAAWAGFLDPAAWEGVPLREVVEAFVDRMAAIYTRRAHVMRVIDREVRLGGDEAVRATVERVNGHVSEGFIRLVESRRDEVAPGHRGDIRGACEYWLMALVAVFRSGLLHPETGPAHGPPDEVVERTVALLVPYLTRE